MKVEVSSDYIMKSKVDSRGRIHIRDILEELGVSIDERADKVVEVAVLDIEEKEEEG